MLSSVFGFEVPQTDAEKQLVEIIYNDDEHIVSSLQLNQLASFTYHETSLTGGRLIHERMLDILERAISRPFDVSIMTMHKSLAVLKHLLLFGAEKVIPAARTLSKYCEIIVETYNTAIMAQQATGATGFLMRLKGGAVDKGGPARQVAQQILDYLNQPETLQFQRQAQADPHSLVPIGSPRHVGFITDEARFAILQRRIEREKQVILKSNLAKSHSAYGSGYTSKDGKQVVGAAHSLEEMIKDAEKKQRAKEQLFSDAPKQRRQVKGQYAGVDSTDIFSDYQAPMSSSSQGTDLLSMDAPAGATTTGDLLDGFQAQPVVPAVTADLLGTSAAAPEGDVFGVAGNTVNNAMFGGGGGGAAAAAAGVHDVFSSPTPAADSPAASSNGLHSMLLLQQQQQGDLLSLSAETGNSTTTDSDFLSLSSMSTSPVKKPVMSASFVAADRFSALDSLSSAPSPVLATASVPPPKSNGVMARPTAAATVALTNSGGGWLPSSTAAAAMGAAPIASMQRQNIHSTNTGDSSSTLLSAATATSSCWLSSGGSSGNNMPQYQQQQPQATSIRNTPNGGTGVGVGGFDSALNRQQQQPAVATMMQQQTRHLSLKAATAAGVNPIASLSASLGSISLQPQSASGSNAGTGAGGGVMMGALPSLPLGLSSITPLPAAVATAAPVTNIATTTSLSSIKVSHLNAPALADDGDEDDVNDGFVMGGAVGSGLEPLGPAPAVPPPPPPAP